MKSSTVLVLACGMLTPESCSSISFASARYSTLQDIDSGRHTEIDMFSGAMMRMGKELEIPTPYNEYTYHMIKALEEKNDGVFEYQGENDRVSWSK